MRLTNQQGFVADQALILADRIESKTGLTVEIDDMIETLEAYRVHDDYSMWLHIAKVLAEYGFDYDEIFEVAL